MSRVQLATQAGTVLLLSFFWGVNWPAMKFVLGTVEPWTFRALLVLVGGVGSLLTARALGHTILLPRRLLVPLLWLGLFQGVLWNAFSGFGIALVEAGRAAVLAFTMPVWATALAIVVLGERLTPRRFGALALGMAAMLLLLLPALEALGRELVGSVLMLTAAVTWAVATIIVKAHDWEVSPLVLGGWQFVVGAGPLWCAAFVLGEPSTLGAMDGTTFLVLAFSALIPMILCQAIFYAIVRRLPATLASMSTLLVPPVGVFSSAILIGETVGPAEIGALVLVVGAMAMILPGFSWRAILRPRPASPPG